MSNNRKQEPRRKGASKNSRQGNMGPRRKISPELETRLRTERVMLVRNCRIYVDTSSLMNSLCRCGLRKLSRIMTDFNRWMYVPACVADMLEHLAGNQKDTAREAGLVLRRLDKRIDSGTAEICVPESAGKAMDWTVQKIVADLPDGERALFITENRALAANVNSMGKVPGKPAYGRVAACRVDADGYLVPLPGMGDSCTDNLGLTSRRSTHSEPTLCPHSYKPSEWDGKLD